MGFERLKIQSPSLFDQLSRLEEMDMLDWEPISQEPSPATSAPPVQLQSESSSQETQKSVWGVDEESQSEEHTEVMDPSQEYD